MKKTFLPGSIVAGLLVGLGGYFAWSNLTPEPVLLLPLFVGLCQLAAFQWRFHPERNREYLPVLFLYAVCVFWYLLPPAAFGIWPEVLDDQTIFDEAFFGRATFGALAGISAFLGGITFSAAKAERAAGTGRNGVSTPVVLETLDSVQHLYLCGLILVVAVVGQLVRPDFSIAEFEQYLDSYKPEYMAISNRAGSVSIVGGILFALALREWLVSRRPLALLASVPNLYHLYVLGVLVGRRQIAFFWGCMVVYTLIFHQRRPMRSLLIALSAGAFLFALVGGLRTTLATTGGIGFGDVVVKLVQEPAQTCSFHARCLAVLEEQPARWGTTFFENIGMWIPFLKDYGQIVSEPLYYHLVVLQTIPWAEQYYYTMGASFVSEAWVNFKVFGLLLLALEGFLLQRLFRRLVASSTSVRPFLLGALALAVAAWFSRSSFLDNLHFIRMVIAIVAVDALFKVISRYRRQPRPAAPLASGRPAQA